MNFFQLKLSKLNSQYLMHVNINSEAVFYEDFRDIFVFPKFQWEVKEKYENVENG